MDSDHPGPSDPHKLLTCGNVVDLLGQLSNTLSSLLSQVVEVILAEPEPFVGVSSADNYTESVDLNNKGRLSNPPRQVQRRLKPDQIRELVEGYVAGELIDDLAERFLVHRVTVMAHVKRAGVKMRWRHRS